MQSGQTMFSQNWILRTTYMTNVMSWRDHLKALIPPLPAVTCFFHLHSGPESAPQRSGAQAYPQEPSLGQITGVPAALYSALWNEMKVKLGSILYLCHVKSSVHLSKVALNFFCSKSSRASVSECSACGLLGGAGNLEEFPFTQWWLSWLLSGKSAHLGGVFKLVSVAVFPCWLISHDAFQQRSIPNFDSAHPFMVTESICKQHQQMSSNA